jgi:hypothetical protein
MMVSLWVKESPEFNRKGIPLTIGTLGEKSLHAAVKRWYAQDGDTLELPVDGYHIDIVRPDPLTLIEIQTRHFHAMKPKLNALLPHYRVHVVHPIAVQRTITLLDAEAKRELSRRKSPKRGRVEEVFRELVRIPDLMSHANFTLEVLLIHDEEIRRDDGQGSWRRKKQSIYDRRLLDVVGSVALTCVDDARALLPPTLPEIFTVNDLAKAAKLARPLAGKMACGKWVGLCWWANRGGRMCIHAVAS